MLTWMDSLKGRSLMRMTSFTDEEMMNLIDLAAQLKALAKAQPGSHIHYDESNSLEEGSAEMVIEHFREKKDFPHS